MITTNNTHLQRLQDLDDTEIAKSVKCSIEYINKTINTNKFKTYITTHNIRSIYTNFVNFETSLSQFNFSIDLIIFAEC